eukprot:403364837
MQRRIQGLDKKPWEQEGRDDQGRKHFYGAFTGALKEFSVGYKGTVGSKEGFQPKQFVSSRSEKKGTQFQQQSIFEFMDEDDMNIQLARLSKQHNNIQIPQIPSKKICLKSGISGDIQNNTFIPDELVVTTNNSKVIPVDEGDGLQRQRQQQILLQSLRRLTRGEDRKNRRGRSTMMDPLASRITYLAWVYPDAAEQRQKKQQNRIKMSEFDYAGIEVDEDDDSVQQISNVYDIQKDKSKMYKDSIELDDEETNQKSSVENQKPNQFIIGGTLQVKKIGAKPVQVPAGYNPFKDQDNQSTTETSNQQSKKRNLIDEIIIDHSKKFISKQSNNLDANKRAEILGETEGIQQTNAQIYNNRFQASTQDQQQIQHQALKQQQSNNQPQQPYYECLNFLIDIPFKTTDPKRYLRFKAYCLDIDGQLVTFDVPNNMMTGSQLKIERQEFDKLIKLNKMMKQQKQEALESGRIDRDQAKYQAGVYTSEMKNRSQQDITKRIEQLEKEINKREEQNWQPAPLLLTRFGLLDPHESKKIKPPMFFKNLRQEQKQQVTFDSKGETLLNIPGSSMANEQPNIDGDEYFRNIQEQFGMNQGMEVVKDKNDDLSPRSDTDLNENIGDQNKNNLYEKDLDRIAIVDKSLMSLQNRPPISLFESIFNNDNERDDMEESV